MNRRLLALLIPAGVLMVGVILMISGEHIGHQGSGTGPVEQPDSGLVLFGGVLVAVAILILSVQGMLILSAAHRRWISQFEPGVQRDIRYMERIAMLGAADLGLREINRRTMDHVNAPRIVPRTEPLPPVTFAPPSPFGLDPVQELLDRSAAIREAHNA